MRAWKVWKLIFLVVGGSVQDFQQFFSLKLKIKN